MASNVQLESVEEGETKKSIKNGESDKKEDLNKISTTKYTKKLRRYPRKNLEIPKLSDRAEKRRAIEQSDSDDETPEERIRRIHTEYKHRYRLRLDAEMMFDLGLNNHTESPNKQPRVTETEDSV